MLLLVSTYIHARSNKVLGRWFHSTLAVKIISHSFLMDTAKTKLLNWISNSTDMSEFV